MITRFLFLSLVKPEAEGRLGRLYSKKQEEFRIEDNEELLLEGGRLQSVRVGGKHIH